MNKTKNGLWLQETVMLLKCCLKMVDQYKGTTTPVKIIDEDFKTFAKDEHGKETLPFLLSSGAIRGHVASRAK